MKCIKCGTNNNNGEYFCRNCGYNLSLINDNQTKKKKRDNHRKQSNKKQNKFVEKKYELIVIFILFIASLINVVSLVYPIASYLLLITIVSVVLSLLIVIVNKLNKKLLILLLIPVLIYGFCFYKKGNTVENSVKEVINKTSLSGDWTCKLNKDEFYLNLNMTSNEFSFKGEYITVEGKIVASNKTKVEGEHEIVIDTTKNVRNGIVVLNEGKTYYTKIKGDVLYLTDNGSGETYKCKK